MMPRAIIITGPTASGKTHVAEMLAMRIGGEIINADMGQMYTPLTIGTAKPNWRQAPVACHLFDILHEPIEFNVQQYRARILELVSEIITRKHVPIIVGGSLFYLSSLFFPPKEQTITTTHKAVAHIDMDQDTAILWQELKTIDPERAAVLHPNDRYRIVRALTLWQQTGHKPSTLRPVFHEPFKALVVVLDPLRNVLYERINKRTNDMVLQGWIDEAHGLLNTSWEPFVAKKGIIGYEQLFAWICAGRLQDTRDAVFADIAQRTRNYAQRQIIFLRKFIRELGAHGVSTYAVSDMTNDGVLLMKRINEFLMSS